MRKFLAVLLALFLLIVAAFGASAKTIQLVVDSACQSSIPSLLTQWESDRTSEGWTVLTRIVSPSSSGALKSALATNKPNATFLVGDGIQFINETVSPDGHPARSLACDWDYVIDGTTLIPYGSIGRIYFATQASAYKLVSGSPVAMSSMDCYTNYFQNRHSYVTIGGNYGTQIRVVDHLTEAGDGVYPNRARALLPAGFENFVAPANLVQSYPDGQLAALASTRRQLVLAFSGGQTTSSPGGLFYFGGPADWRVNNPQVPIFGAFGSFLCETTWTDQFLMATLTTGYTVATAYDVIGLFQWSVMYGSGNGTMGDAGVQTWFALNASGFQNISTIYGDPSIAFITTPSNSTRIVQLPIEVQAFPGATISAMVTVPNAAQVSTMWVKAHNLSYADKGSVRINSGAWVNIDNSAVTVENAPASHGGVGGAYNTYQFHFTPSGVVTGANQISFRFNGTDGNGSGFRILDFDFKDASGTRLLASGWSQQDDPSNWVPPLNNSPDIAAGLLLFQTASIVDKNAGGRSITATCANCHAADGRDLQYFGYSNYSIIGRCMFHGLSEHQGEQVASYIRSLKTSAGIQVWGRPWNPPYQPGPGIDAKPVGQWAAGSGLVLANDGDSLPYVFPDGITSTADIALASTLNVRQVPVALSLPDWNQWLPKYYPGDSYGATWASSNVLKKYDGSGSGASTFNFKTRFAGGEKFNTTMINDLGNWNVDFVNFETALTDGVPDNVWNQQYSERIYSIRLWNLVKMWEMLQVNGLEGEGTNIYSTSQAESRCWPPPGIAFRSGPFQMRLPANENGVAGVGLVSNTLSMMWYHLQLVQNASNRAQAETVPIDWPYNNAHFQNMWQSKNISPPTATSNRYSGSGRPEPMRHYIWDVKGMQMADNTIGPSNWRTGWQPVTRHQAIAFMGDPLTHGGGWFAGYSSGDRNTIIETYLNVWWPKTKSYLASQYGAGGFMTLDHAHGEDSPTIDFTEDCTGSFQQSFGQTMWMCLKEWNTLGINQALLNDMATWCGTVWTNPVNNWTQFIH